MAKRTLQAFTKILCYVKCMTFTYEYDIAYATYLINNNDVLIQSAKALILSFLRDGTMWFRCSLHTAVVCMQSSSVWTCQQYFHLSWLHYVWLLLHQYILYAEEYVLNMKCCICYLAEGDSSDSLWVSSPAPQPAASHLSHCRDGQSTTAKRTPLAM